jgi:anthranilate synthase/aminodeoxychorismate synthase-like glutamine amidotransferase
MTRPVLLIDNLDSFTFNLVEAFERLGAEVQVLRNRVSAPAALAIAEAKGALIVLSPGPGRPEEAGCCLALIGLAKGRAPLLGVCLGHQAIVLEAGGIVERAPVPVHGKVNVQRGLANPVGIGRYHSLCTRHLPPRFTVHAEIDGMAMAISDMEARQAGLQFHPESVLTRSGDSILANILEGL